MPAASVPTGEFLGCYDFDGVKQSNPLSIKINLPCRDYKNSNKLIDRSKNKE